MSCGSRTLWSAMCSVAPLKIFLIYLHNAVAVVVVVVIVVAIVIVFCFKAHARAFIINRSRISHNIYKQQQQQQQQQHKIVNKQA